MMWTFAPPHGLMLLWWTESSHTGYRFVWLLHLHFPFCVGISGKSQRGLCFTNDSLVTLKVLIVELIRKASVDVVDFSVRELVWELCYRVPCVLIQLFESTRVGQGQCFRVSEWGRRILHFLSVTRLTDLAFYASKTQLRRWCAGKTELINLFNWYAGAALVVCTWMMICSVIWNV